MPLMSDKSKIYVIYLIYGDTHLESGLQILRKKVEKLFAGSTPLILVVDNKLSPNSSVAKHDDYRLIGGDNSVREFSGWDVAIRLLQSEYAPSADDILIIANDTFHRSYGIHYLDFFTTKKVSRGLQKCGLVGYVDRYPTKVSFDKKPFTSWVRTSFFIAPYSVIEKLSPFAIRNRSSEIFTGKVNPFFDPNGPLDSRYQQYLATWLYSDSTDGIFRQSWHSKVKLTDESLPDVQAKTLSIICEHQLSQRALAANFPLVDVRPRTLSYYLKKIVRPIRHFMNGGQRSY